MSPTQLSLHKQLNSKIKVYLTLQKEERHLSLPILAQSDWATIMP